LSSHCSRPDKPDKTGSTRLGDLARGEGVGGEARSGARGQELVEKVVQADDLTLDLVALAQLGAQVGRTPRRLRKDRIPARKQNRRGHVVKREGQAASGISAARVLEKTGRAGKEGKGAHDWGRSDVRVLGLVCA